jgi:hypothetical protein
MILGLSIAAFTFLHVIISLVGIASGLIALWAMLRGRAPDWITHVFLVTTALTTLTGFLFPITAFTPALGVGLISIALLIVAFAALYIFHLAGPWRWIYVVTATAALYLNCFVLVVQIFQKVPFFSGLAPTQTELPFLIAQVVLLADFIWLGYQAVRRFNPPGAGAPALA